MMNLKSPAEAISVTRKFDDIKIMIRCYDNMDSSKIEKHWDQLKDLITYQQSTTGMPMYRTHYFDPPLHIHPQKVAKVHELRFGAERTRSGG